MTKTWTRRGVISGMLMVPGLAWAAEVTGLCSLCGCC